MKPTTKPGRVTLKAATAETMFYDGSGASFVEIYEWMGGDTADSANLGHEGPGEDRPMAFGVRTRSGKAKCWPGDWVVKTAGGDFAVYTRAEFLATFDTEADAG